MFAPTIQMKRILKRQSLGKQLEVIAKLKIENNKHNKHVCKQGHATNVNTASSSFAVHTRMPPGLCVMPFCTPTATSQTLSIFGESNTFQFFLILYFLNVWRI